MSDIEPRVSLAVLDPGVDDPGYWDRLHGRIMNSVAPHFLRPEFGPQTIGDALLSWSRLVIPLAAAAAVAAFVVLLQPGASDDLAQVAGFEELLHRPADGQTPLPPFLHLDAEVDRNMILLAMEEF